MVGLVLRSIVVFVVVVGAVGPRVRPWMDPAPKKAKLDGDDGGASLPPDPCALDGGRVTPPTSKLGQWNTHVAVPVKLPKWELEELRAEALKAGGRKPLTSEGVFAWVEPDALHVSVSRSVGLYQHELEPFKRVLETHLRKLALPEDAPLRISLRSDEFVELPGAEGNGAYLCALVEDGESTLVELVSAVDAAMAEFDRPPYFDPPIFHVSLAYVSPRRSSTALRLVAAEQQGNATGAMPRTHRAEEAPLTLTLTSGGKLRYNIKVR